MSENSFRSLYVDLLNQIKTQHNKNSGRPTLHRVLEQGDEPVTEPTYVWQSSAGLSASATSPAGECEVKTIEALIESADLVPTITQFYYFDNLRLRLIQHFDDVRFGYDAQDAFVIFRLSPEGTFSDSIMTPDKDCDAAIEELKKRFHYQKAMIDDPIVVREGDQNYTIRPIITDTNVIEIRKRQRQFNAG